jgi:hypothetical protein
VRPGGPKIDRLILNRPGIVDVWGLGGPGGRGDPAQRWGAKRPTFWKGFPAVGAAKMPKHILFPSGLKAMY